MNINDLKIKTKIIFGAMFLVLITLVLGILAYSYISNLSNTLTNITDNNAKAVEYATGVERMALAVIMEEKNYLLEETDDVYQRAEGNVKELYGFLDKVDELAAEYNNSELFDQSKIARKGTEEYAEKYREGVNALKENKKLGAMMVEKGNIVGEAADEFLRMQVVAYDAAKSRGAGIQELDANVRRYIMAADIYEHALKIMRAEKEEVNYKDRAAYKQMQVLLPELMQLYDELEKITANREELQLITEARGATEEYEGEAVNWIKNDDKLQVILTDMKELGLNVIKQAQDAEAAGYNQLEAAKADAKALSSQASIVIIITILASIILGIIIALVLASIITGPIVKGVGFAQTMAEGDLTSTLDITQKDEIGILAGALNDMVENFREIVGNVTSSADNVAGAADQVSQASQSLSQGTTEQASSLEEISSSLNEINSQSKQNAENATEANALAKTSAENADGGNRHMQELVAAMGKINESSEEIKKVVKVIDDIAFQINLLALNANVEAARVGKYGKGFAVVADEVRNLAVRSAEAVKDTASMVDETTRNVEEGARAAEGTARQLEEIVAGSSKVADFLGEIALASKEQAQGVEQINSGVEQIDQVTQANTASAEESAAASEELASQAQQLKGLISRFKLLDSGDGKYRERAREVSQGAQKILRMESNRREERVSAGNGGGEKTGVRIPVDNAIGGGAQEPVDPKEVIKLDDDEFGKF